MGGLLGGGASTKPSTRSIFLALAEKAALTRSIGEEKVQVAAADERKRRARAGGRASTILTARNDPEAGQAPSAQRFLGTA